MRHPYDEILVGLDLCILFFLQAHTDTCEDKKDPEDEQDPLEPAQQRRTNKNHDTPHHQRADDGPAYLTILIVGHLMAPLLMVVFETWRPEPLVLFTIFAIGCVALSLYLLPRLKGVMIGFQWARYMHGSGRAG